MRRTLGSFAARGFAWSCPVLIALSGCGGVGRETPNTPPQPARTATTPAPSNLGEPTTAQGKMPGTGELTTPTRSVDTKSLIDVVREEVTGGEAASGGSPESYLWLPPDLEKIAREEPLDVKVPKGLQSLLSYVPASNPLTRSKVELGKQLYFDQRVSLNGTVSCATCHNPEKGWTDNAKTSAGIDGQLGGRNAPTVLNTVYGKTMFWDGRAPSLEGQSQGPIQNPIEMGKQSYKEIIQRLRTISGYNEQFQKVFGTEVTLDGFAKAVAAFERVAALSGNSKYDQYNGGAMGALSASEKRGMVLFGLRLSPDDEFKTDVVLQKAKCTHCHGGFNFTDEQFHNLGIGWVETENKFADLGRFAIEPIGAKNPASYGAFKTPTVRDAARTGPYMHDGSLTTLEAVVEHYDKGGIANPALDKDMKKLDLTKPEKADVVAFMKALTGESPRFEMPTLPAGPDGKTPDPRAALSAPAPRAAMNFVHPPIR